VVMQARVHRKRVLSRELTLHQPPVLTIVL
jgi:hypothetical protein